jgi:hypothetical protein
MSSLTPAWASLPTYYLQFLYNSPPSCEPLLATTGGLPLDLATRIESDLITLEKLRINFSLSP